jgi:hypothetical protein
MKEITIYNTLKSRLETVHFDFTPENTTWFEVRLLIFIESQTVLADF